MQAAARDLAATDKDASSKIRRALGDMQQDELSRNMSLSAEMIRRGYGAAAAMRESMTTQSLNNLRDKLRDAAAAGVKGKNGEKGLEQALEQAENMRRQMEQMTRSLRGEKGQQGQTGQGQQPGQKGQPGQQPGQQGQGQGQGQQSPQGQAGQQPGQGQSAQGQSSGGQQFGQGTRSPGEGREAGASPGGGVAGGYNGGNWGQRWNGQWNGDPAVFERGYRETLRDLSRLRENLGDNPDISRDVQDLMREMQRIDPRRFGTDPLLAERINSQVVSGLEQIELQLRRKLEEQQGGSVRSGASEAAPPGYANSVADYFKKLSKDK
jgi:hypothetical protein